jgi:hypothetical protein
MANTEIDRLMERSNKKNASIRARALVNKKKCNDRAATIAKSTEESINANWSFLYDQMTQAHSILSTLDMQIETAPKSQFSAVKTHLDAVMGRMKENNITRLGNSSVRSEVGFVLNAIVGIRHGLAEKEISRAKIDTLLPGLANRLDTVCKNMEERVDGEKVAIARRRYEIKLKRLEEARRRALVASATPTKARKFMSMSEAMALVQDESQDNIRKLEAEAAAAVAPEPLADWVVREDSKIRDVAKGYPKELQAIKDAITKSGISKSEEIRHVFVRGPIAILTKPQLNEGKLRRANVDYQVMPFNSIVMGWRGGMQGMGGGKREYIPHMFILMDQVLVAIGSKTNRPAPPKPKSEKRGLVLRSPPKPLKSQGNPDLIREDISDIIQARTGTAYIDVVKETTGTSSEYLRSKSLPGMRFVWLLKRSTYDKIGPFSIESVGLPF